jgi:uncharacterized protein (DUF305 family)
MAFSNRLVCAALLLSIPATTPAQQPKPATGNVPIVQPGAPGQNSKTLSPATAATPPRAPTDADIGFMQGMIVHHSQAVDMVDLLRTRSRNKELQSLGKRISISQTDEIQFMKQWLQDHGKPVSLGPGRMDHSGAMKGMAGMDHAMMDHSMMPGMLTPQQMQALAKANGKAFDRLFLTGMIQHHNGALIMVDELFGTAGAGQDNVLYDFATDIDNTQRAEIEIMRGMLKEKK